MIYVLHGENELAQKEALEALLESLKRDDGLEDLNTETLTPPLDLSAFYHACDTLPFLGDMRIVIVRDGLAKASKQVTQEIADYLPKLPPTTQLIFIESARLSAKHPVLKQAKKINANIQLFAAVKERDLPKWIRERAEYRGCTMAYDAIQLLAGNIGPDLRLLDQEIQKLKLYKGDKSPITVEDVNMMVPYIQSADVIFNMVDALGQRNPRKALHHLHRLLDAGEHPLGIFGMVVRQYRLLIQTDWLLNRGHTEKSVAARLKLHPYVAGKICAQANYYNQAQLRAAYRQLLESDLAIKQGKIKPEASLDLLVAQLTRL